MQHLPGLIFQPLLKLLRLQNLYAMYETGKGSVRARAVYHIEKGEIVITALPHQASGAKLSSRLHSKCLARSCRQWWIYVMSRIMRIQRIVIVPKSNRIDLDANAVYLPLPIVKNPIVNLNMIGAMVCQPLKI